MKHEINRIFDQITSEKSDSEFLSQALRKAETDMKKHTFNKKALVVPLAAALALGIGAVGVGAAYNYAHLTELFGGNENISAEIQTDIFTDSDGHVAVTMEQLVSDGRHVHSAVHYEALDEVGKEWLDNDVSFLLNSYGCNELVNIKYLDSDGNEKDPGTYGGIELAEHRTDTDRYFYTKCRVHDDDWGEETLNMIFNYPMCGTLKKAEFSVESTLETRRYEIAGDERSSKYLTPTYLDISALSYVLYGNDDFGLVKSEMLPKGGYKQYISVSDDEYSKEVTHKPISLVMADGERIKLANEASGSNGAEWVWASGEIFDFDEPNHCWTADYSITFEFEELVGIEIDGVYYELVAE